MKKVFKIIVIPFFIALIVVKVAIKDASIDHKTQFTLIKEKQSIAGARSYWINRLGQYPSDEIFVKALKKAKKQLLSVPKKRTLGLTWKELGPDNIGGRTRAILIDNENPNLLYAGGVSGGLWYSTDEGLTWNATTPGDDEDVLTVNCITQDKDGYVYYGTGEGVFYGVDETAPGIGGYGFRGKGIYKSTTPHGTEFEHLSDSWSGKESSSIAINALASDTLGNIYAAAKEALYKSSNQGLTWMEVSSLTDNSTINGIAYDVKVTPNGTVYLAMGNEYYKSLSGDPNSFELISGTGKSLPSAKGRSTIAIAPSKTSVVYVLRATYSGIFDGLYKSTDGGQNWTTIIGGSSSAFEPFKGGGYQGEYNQCLAVFPNNPDRILLGGIELYEWQQGGNWEKKSSWSASWGDHNYIHADLHSIVFHPTDTNKYYVGSDGGIFRTKNQGEIYERLNRGFNVTQFYGVGFGKDGVVIGGTQDNSTVYIDYQGNTTQAGDIHYEGDGGYAEISNLYPDAFFVESQYGRIVRGNTRQDDYAEFFYHPQSPFEIYSGFDYDNLWSEFITPFKLWESRFDSLVPDSVEFVANQAYAKGDTIELTNDIPLQKFTHILDANLNTGDTVQIKNPQQSMLVYGTRNAVYIIRNHLAFGDSTEWIELTKKGCVLANNGPTCFAVSDDGNYLYYGNSVGEIYRVSNLCKVISGSTADSAEVTKIAAVKTDDNKNAFITDISVNPKNPDDVIFTVGKYDESTNIYAYNNATSTTTITDYYAVNGNLPQIPIYSAIIEYNSGAYIIGTEYGVFNSEDSGATWYKDNGIPNAPVTMIRQQTFKWAPNFGQIYVATHGRGLFTSESYVTSMQEISPNKTSTTTLSLYPNPTSNQINFTGVDGRKKVEIFNVNGQVVMSKTIKNNKFSVIRLPQGVYTVKVTQNQRIYTSKLVKR